MNAPDFEKSIVPWLGKTGKMLNTFMAEQFRQHNLDLSPEQFIILKILHDEDGQPQNDMALVTDRHKASLTRLLDTMENKYLVTRISDPQDKRVKRVYLTKLGRQHFDSVLPVVGKAMAEIQRGLTKKETDTLISILKKVQRNISF